MNSTSSLAGVASGWLVVCLLVAVGCRDSDPGPTKSQKAPTPRAAVELAVLVVDDPELAAGVRLLRGEWSERSGGGLRVEELESADLFAADAPPADLIIYPSRLIGSLAARDWLRPVRDSVLQGASLQFKDLLPLVRDHTMRYGDEIYAISLGEPPLMLKCRTDEVDALQSTWEDFSFVLDCQFDSPNFPLAIEVLLRANAYAGGRGVSLFDPQTMKPAISGPPFEKAFEDVLRVHGGGSESQPGGSVGLSWPSAERVGADDEAAGQLTFVAPPKARQVYDADVERWTPNEEPDVVPVFGFAGRSVSVFRSTRNATSAFKLLEWLTSGNAAVQLSRRSGATIWYRNSQQGRAGDWLKDERIDDRSIEEANRLLSAKHCYLLPRIPGIDDYLAELELAVEEALDKNHSAEEAIAATAAKWEALTDRLGRERQREALRKHLGLVRERD